MPKTRIVTTNFLTQELSGMRTGKSKGKNLVITCLCFLCSLDEAESTSFSVELGDLIVLATDGLFDNVSTEQILKELSHLEVRQHCSY